MLKTAFYESHFPHCVILRQRPWIFWFFVADNNRRHLEGTDFLGDQGIQSSAKLMDMYHLDLR